MRKFLKVDAKDRMFQTHQVLRQMKMLLNKLLKNWVYLVFLGQDLLLLNSKIQKDKQNKWEKYLSRKNLVNQ